MSIDRTCCLHHQNYYYPPPFSSHNFFIFHLIIPFPTRKYSYKIIIKQRNRFFIFLLLFKKYIHNILILEDRGELRWQHASTWHSRRTWPRLCHLRIILSSSLLRRSWAWAWAWSFRGREESSVDTSTWSSAPNFPTLFPSASVSTLRFVTVSLLQLFFFFQLMIHYFQLFFKLIYSNQQF